MWTGAAGAGDPVGVLDPTYGGSFAAPEGAGGGLLMLFSPAVYIGPGSTISADGARGGSCSGGNVNIGGSGAGGGCVYIVVTAAGGCANHGSVTANGGPGGTATGGTLVRPGAAGGTGFVGAIGV